MNIKKVASVAGIALASLMLVGCTPVTAGTVVSHEFTPAHKTTTSSCHGTKPIICTPTTHRYDDQWEVELSAENKDGDTETSWVEVSESTYNDLQDGDYYDSEKDEN